MAREMKDSGIEWIGEIPDEWKTVRFKFLHNGLNTGEAIDKQYWTDNINDIVFYTAGLTPIRTCYIDFPKWKYTTNHDLLLARNGTPYVYFPITNACYSDHIIRADIKGNINRRFVGYSLQRSISSVIVNTVSISTWSASLWNEQIIPLPPLPEQHRIADFLDRKCAEIDRVLEKTRASIEEYKKLKQSVITQAVTKGVRGEREMKDSGIEWIGEIPAEWKISRIKYVSSFEPPCDTSRLSPDSVITYTPMEYIKNGYYVPNTATLSSLSTSLTSYQSGDIVMAKVTPCFENGNISIMNNLSSAFGLGSSELFVFRAKSIHTQFLFYWLRNNRFVQTACSTMTGTGGLKRVSSLFVKDSSLAVPPESEQIEIANYLDKKCSEIDTLISKKEQFITELESYKKSLIYEYVTGKKEVQ